MSAHHAELARELEQDGARLLWLSREDINEEGAVAILVAAPDDEPALALVTAGDTGAALVELSVDVAGGLLDALRDWIEATS